MKFPECKLGNNEYALSLFVSTMSLCNQGSHGIGLQCDKRRTS